MSFRVFSDATYLFWYSMIYFLTLISSNLYQNWQKYWRHSHFFQNHEGSLSEKVWKYFDIFFYNFVGYFMWLELICYFVKYFIFNSCLCFYHESTFSNSEVIKLLHIFWKSLVYLFKTTKSWKNQKVGRKGKVHVFRNMESEHQKAETKGKTKKIFIQKDKKTSWNQALQQKSHQKN